MNINNAIQPNHGPGRRLQRIIEILSASGFGSVSALAETLGVSEMTIRRDLDKLETQNYIRRTHGGAITESKNQIEIVKKIKLGIINCSLNFNNVKIEKGLKSCDCVI